MVDPKYLAGSFIILTSANISEFVFYNPYILQNYIFSMIPLSLFIGWLWLKIDNFPRLASILSASIGGVWALSGYHSIILNTSLGVFFGFLNIFGALVFIKYSLGKVAYEM